MELPEWNLEFDILFNNIASNQAPDLDLYEKSVFLTQAQEALVASLYGGQASSAYHFEHTEAIKRYLDTLVLTEYIKPIQTPTSASPKFSTLTPQSYICPLPEDTWFIVYEDALIKSSNNKCLNERTLTVSPTPVDELYKIQNNPFRRASGKRVLRLDRGDRYITIDPVSQDVKSNQAIVELIGHSSYNIDSYKLRYIKNVPPIILEDLPQGLSINGQDKAQNCILHSAVHRTILQNAVALAAAHISQSK